MKLITAIVRPEKVMDVIKALEQEGYFAFSKWAISGRGKEKGIQVGVQIMLKRNASSATAELLFHF
jgi:nitrogen regulatory protein PII